MNNKGVSTQIRSYLPGDEESLIRLWNLSYGTYGGYVPRSLEYWRSSILGKPGVTPDDLMILQIKNEILGYAVLGPDGFILEFAVDPRLPERSRLNTASSLIKAIEERSLSRGDETIQLEVPFSDQSICRALREADIYDKKASEFLNVIIIDLVGLLTKILGHRQQESKIPEEWSPTFLFNIKPGQYRFCPVDHLLIQMGSPPVVKEVKEVPDEPSIEINLSAFTDLIFRLTTFEKAVSDGALVIPSESSRGDVQILMNLIAIESTWFTFFADYQ